MNQIYVIVESDKYQTKLLGKTQDYDEARKIMLSAFRDVFLTSRKSADWDLISTQNEYRETFFGFNEISAWAIWEDFTHWQILEVDLSDMKIEST